MDVGLREMITLDDSLRYSLVPAEMSPQGNPIEDELMGTMIQIGNDLGNVWY